MLVDRMLRYAPDGAEGGASESVESSTESGNDSYEDNFGSSPEQAAKEKPIDFDKMLADQPTPVSFDDEPEVIKQTEETKEEKSEEEQKPEEPPKPPADPNEYEKLKAEYEEYKKGEEQRFNQFYANLKKQEQEQAALPTQVDSLFANEEFTKKLDAAETGNDVAKIIMTESVKMADNLLKTKLAPVFQVLQAYQQEQIEKRTNEVFTNFRAKYGQEAERVLTPGTPEHKALVAELQANPTLPLEKAFLLVKPSFAQKQIQSEVKKAIDEKRSMALTPSAGKSSKSASNRIETIDDAIAESIKQYKAKRAES